MIAKNFDPHHPVLTAVFFALSPVFTKQGQHTFETDYIEIVRTQTCTTQTVGRKENNI